MLNSHLNLSARGPYLVGAFSVIVKSLRPSFTALVTRHQADPDNTSPRPHFLAASSGSKDLWVNTLKFKVGKHPCAHCGVCVLCSVIASVTIQFWYSQSPIVAALHTPANLFRIYSWHQEVNPTYVVRLVSIVCRLWRDVQIMCPPLLDCNIFFQFQFSEAIIFFICTNTQWWQATINCPNFWEHGGPPLRAHSHKKAGKQAAVGSWMNT